MLSRRPQYECGHCSFTARNIKTLEDHVQQHNREEENRGNTLETASVLKTPHGIDGEPSSIGDCVEHDEEERETVDSDIDTAQTGDGTESSNQGCIEEEDIDVETVCDDACQMTDEDTSGQAVHVVISDNLNTESLITISPRNETETEAESISERPSDEKCQPSSESDFSLMARAKPVLVSLLSGKCVRNPENDTSSLDRLAPVSDQSCHTFVDDSDSTASCAKPLDGLSSMCISEVVSLAGMHVESLECPKSNVSGCSETDSAPETICMSQSGHGLELYDDDQVVLQNDLNSNETIIVKEENDAGQLPSYASDVWEQALAGNNIIHVLPQDREPEETGANFADMSQYPQNHSSGYSTSDSFCSSFDAAKIIKEEPVDECESLIDVVNVNEDHRSAEQFPYQALGTSDEGESASEVNEVSPQSHAGVDSSTLLGYSYVTQNIKTYYCAYCHFSNPELKVVREHMKENHGSEVMRNFQATLPALPQTCNDRLISLLRKEIKAVKLKEPNTDRHAMYAAAKRFLDRQEREQNEKKKEVKERKSRKTPARNLSPKLNRNPTRSVDSAEARLSCSVCNRLFKTAQTLRVHQFNLHGLDIPVVKQIIVDTTSESTVVVERPSSSSVKSNLTGSVDSVEARLSCSLCNRLFKTAQTLRIHQWNIHGLSIPTIKYIDTTTESRGVAESSSASSVNFKCFFCSFASVKYEDVMEHLGDKHSKMFDKQNSEDWKPRLLSGIWQHPAKKELNKGHLFIHSSTPYLMDGQGNSERTRGDTVDHNTEGLIDNKSDENEPETYLENVGKQHVKKQYLNPRMSTRGRKIKSRLGTCSCSGCIPITGQTRSKKFHNRTNGAMSSTEAENQQELAKLPEQSSSNGQIEHEQDASAEEQDYNIQSPNPRKHYPHEGTTFNEPPGPSFDGGSPVLENASGHLIPNPFQDCQNPSEDATSGAVNTGTLIYMESGRAAVNVFTVKPQDIVTQPQGFEMPTDSNQLLPDSVELKYQADWNILRDHLANVKKSTRSDVKVPSRHTLGSEDPTDSSRCSTVESKELKHSSERSRVSLHMEYSETGTQKSGEPKSSNNLKQRSGKKKGLSKRSRASHVQEYSDESQQKSDEPKDSSKRRRQSSKTKLLSKCSLASHDREYSNKSLQKSDEPKCANKRRRRSSEIKGSSNRCGGSQDREDSGEGKQNIGPPKDTTKRRRRTSELNGFISKDSCRSQNDSEQKSDESKDSSKYRWQSSESKGLSNRSRASHDQEYSKESEQKSAEPKDSSKCRRRSSVTKGSSKRGLHNDGEDSNKTKQKSVELKDSIKRKQRSIDSEVKRSSKIRRASDKRKASSKRTLESAKPKENQVIPMLNSNRCPADGSQTCESTQKSKARRTKSKLQTTCCLEEQQAEAAANTSVLWKLGVTIGKSKPKAKKKGQRKSSIDIKLTMKPVVLIPDILQAILAGKVSNKNIKYSK